MAVPKELTRLLGSWQGSSKLWLSPQESARESDSTAVVDKDIQGQFLQVRYTWSVEGEPQNGLILVR